jgi:hypothetical protein
MASGKSLHIGLNTVDPVHYDGWDGELRACENDARDMEKLAADLGYGTRTVLLTKEADAETVTAAIREAANVLAPGDIFFMSYSGHGGQVPDGNAEPDEDGLDETWLLYDRQLVDDELYAHWAMFRPGVRIVMLSDSCHSGSVLKFNLVQQIANIPGVVPPELSGDQIRMRGMDVDKAKAVYEKNHGMYDKLQTLYPSAERIGVGASVLLISGCQDNQVSLDGPKNGAFTQALLAVWKNGKFTGGYRKFHRHVVNKLPITQTPNYATTGAPNPVFERQRPFTI